MRGEMTAWQPGTASVLLIDDDATILAYYQDVLAPLGHRLEVAHDGEEAAWLIEGKRYDLIVSDLTMPRMGGIELLRTVRKVDLDVPVVLVTATPGMESALSAIELGAFRYLTKPVDANELRRVASYGVTMSRMARAKREALKIVSGLDGFAADKVGLAVSFERALAFSWMAYQPIVSWSRRAVVGYEALARTAEPAFTSPLMMIEAAERLGRTTELGRRFRELVVDTVDAVPADAAVFVNVHPRDLADPDLLANDSPLASVASRVVLEITERASVDAIPGATERIATLRSLGYRIAIDDLGAGHAGLSTFTRIEPDIAKLDMGLVRGVDRDATKQKVIRSMAQLCRDLGVLVVSEGVETREERDALADAGCDVQQGYLFGRPERGIRVPLFA